MKDSPEIALKEKTASSKSPPLALLVVVLASLTAFAPLSIDMYLPSFSQIAADFGVKVARVELSLATFFVGLAFGQLLYGTATDRFGRKRVLVLPWLALFVLVLPAFRLLSELRTPAALLIATAFLTLLHIFALARA